MNEERAASLAAASAEPLVVLDMEQRLVAASPSALARFPALVVGAALPGGVLEGDAAPLALFLGELPTAYAELRAGFTAAVSHELRTPLARLLSLLESAELPDADVGELVEQARREVDQIRELIDDVLFLGELETGAGVVALGRTLALPILQSVVDELREGAARAGVAISVGGNSALELPLRPRMLRVVAENLAENAIRYAGAGATLRLTLTAAGATSVLTAVDDGAGVTADDLPRLFERFYRADPARASRGTGLGLAIVKHVVTAAGGRVEASGEPGKGLEIRCFFPAAGL